MSFLSKLFRNRELADVERGIKSARKAIERRVKDQRKDIEQIVRLAIDEGLKGLAPVAQDAVMQTLMADIPALIERRVKEAAKGVL